MLEIVVLISLSLSLSYQSQGVYLTDMFAKVALTCKDTPATKFALICEVDLGKIHLLEQPGPADIPSGFNSIKQTAKWHPTESQCVYWKGNSLYLFSLLAHPCLTLDLVFDHRQKHSPRRGNHHNR